MYSWSHSDDSTPPNHPTIMTAVLQHLLIFATAAAHLSFVVASAAGSSSPGSGAPAVESVAFYHGDVGNYTSDALATLSGGDQPFVAMAECSYEEAYVQYLEELNSDGEDDDDADEDDDDGHCSMLSNASLRRTSITANGSGGRTPSNDPSATANTNGEQQSQQHKQRVIGPAFARRLASGPSGGISGMFKGRNLSLIGRRRRESVSSGTLHTSISIRGGAVPVTSAQSGQLGRRLFVAALITILYEFALGHLLEFVKIVMQTSPEGTTYSDVMKSITGEKGIVGIWDGFMPWGVVQSIMKGGVFGFAHAAAAGFLQPLAEDDKIPMIVALALAGAFGGLFQGYVLSPTLLLKTRVMTNDVFRENMNFIRTTWLSLRIGCDVVKDEGILALMKGSNIFALKRLFDWFTRFIFSDLSEALLLKFSSTGTLTTGEKVVASLMGGTLSTFSTLPLDVLVAKSQDAKKAGEAVSAWDMFKAELDEKGWDGLAKSYMNGFEARLAHVCFTTIVMKTFAPILYDYLYGNKEPSP